MPDPIDITKPKVDPLAFPKFPTLFTQQDSLRLKELGIQRKTMEQAYNLNYSPKVWAAKSPVETFVREKLPLREHLQPAIAALTPESWGLALGYTPEEATAKMEEASKEYFELTRRQEVSDIFEGIQTDLLMLLLEYFQQTYPKTLPKKKKIMWVCWLKQYPQLHQHNYYLVLLTYLI